MPAAGWFGSTRGPKDEEMHAGLTGGDSADLRRGEAVVPAAMMGRAATANRTFARMAVKVSRSAKIPTAGAGRRGASCLRRPRSDGMAACRFDALAQDLRLPHRQVATNPWETPMRITRRSALALLGSTAVAGALRQAHAADRFVTIGINLPLTGAAAEDATNILHGAQLAIEEANARGGIGGYEIRQLVLDDGTATAGQYDPAQSAINTRKMIVDPSVVAAVGPMASGSGKAMAPLLSQGNLATVTPSSTNPDLTDPKFAEMYRSCSSTSAAGIEAGEAAFESREPARDILDIFVDVVSTPVFPRRRKNLAKLEELGRSSLAGSLLWIAKDKPEQYFRLIPLEPREIGCRRRAPS